MKHFNYLRCKHCYVKNLFLLFFLTKGYFYIGYFSFSQGRIFYGQPRWIWTLQPGGVWWWVCCPPVTAPSQPSAPRCPAQSRYPLHLCPHHPPLGELPSFSPARCGSLFVPLCFRIHGINLCRLESNFVCLLWLFITETQQLLNWISAKNVPPSLRAFTWQRTLQLMNHFLGFVLWTNTCFLICRVSFYCCGRVKVVIMCFGTVCQTPARVNSTEDRQVLQARPASQPTPQ